MITLILLLTGASHTGKTYLSQKLMERINVPYLSIDHLKMGLIRSGQTQLTPSDNELLTPYLWSILREMIKTAVENGQDLIVEGCYIPFDWGKDFEEAYLKHIRYCCIILSQAYVERNFQSIQSHANVIECRMDDSGCNAKWLVEENRRNLQLCQLHGCPYLLIEDVYSPEELVGHLVTMTGKEGEACPS